MLSKLTCATRTQLLSVPKMQLVKQSSRANACAPGRSCTFRPSIRNPSTRRLGITSDTAPTTAPKQQSHQPRELVDEILALVAQSENGGLDLPNDTKDRLDQILDQLEAYGRQQQPRPLNNPILWGNYNVVYTSTRRSNQQQGEPAGGRFRSKFGQSIFKPNGLYQSVLEPDLATNKVAFRLFGFIDGCIGLRGKIIKIEDGNDDTVRVRFEPAVLSFGSIHLRLGLPSEVQLTTTYLDERIRLGKGSRGSLFVFARGGNADSVGMPEVGLQYTDRGTLALTAAALVGGMLGSLALLLTTDNILLKAISSLVMFMGLGFSALLQKGGISNGDFSAQNSEYWRKREEAAAKAGQSG